MSLLGPVRDALYSLTYSYRSEPLLGHFDTVTEIDASGSTHYRKSFTRTQTDVYVHLYMDRCIDRRTETDRSNRNGLQMVNSHIDRFTDVYGYLQICQNRKTNWRVETFNRVAQSCRHFVWLPSALLPFGV